MTKFTKISLAVVLITFITTSLAQAAFNIPSYVYKINQLGSAKKAAKSSKKPIAFILSDKNTDCGLATAASNDLFKGLKNHCIIVYVQSGKDWKKLPPIVQSGMNSSASGQYIPKTVVVNSSLKNTVCIIPYAKTKQRKSLIKQAQSLISRS